MMTAMVIPVSAASAYTTITEDSTDQSADTELSFQVAPTYTVTIPEKVELSLNVIYNYYHQRDYITATKVVLSEGQTLNVTLDSEYALSVEGAEYTLPYTVKATQSSTVRNVTAQNNLVAAFGSSKDAQQVMVEFQTTDEPQYTGDYSDTVTFNIAVEQPFSGSGD